MSELIDIGNEGHLRILRLNRPEKKNARNASLARGVLGAIEAAADDDVWIVGPTGAATRSARGSIPASWLDGRRFPSA